VEGITSIDRSLPSSILKFGGSATHCKQKPHTWSRSYHDPINDTATARTGRLSDSVPTTGAGGMKNTPVKGTHAIVIYEKSNIGCDNCSLLREQRQLSTVEKSVIQLRKVTPGVVTIEEQDDGADSVTNHTM